MINQPSQKNPPVVLAVTGASGAIYARRLLEWLGTEGVPVHLVLSSAAEEVIGLELGQAAPEWDRPGVIRHDIGDFAAPIASGSFRHRGMVICPCTMGTLAAVAHGISLNLIHRAADVTLKERRALIIVPRENPLSAIHLENMLILARAGAAIIPAMPSYYSRPRTVEEVADTVVGRIIDALGMSHALYQPWEGIFSKP
ncbi:MAG: UbiX family flavin prenyltransferase [Pseudomonadota bacterium]